MVRKFGTSENDVIYGDINASNDIYGFEGDDKLYGGNNHDHLWGDIGNDLLVGNGFGDELYGGDGNDTLEGGEGEDLLVGNEGNDTYKFGDNFGIDTIVDIDGNNYLNFNGISSSYYININLAAKTFSSTAGSFTETAFLGYVGNITGSKGNDNIYGNNSANYLAGGTGNDFIDGGAGNDNICGNQGNDIIYGGQGNDSINGGEGNDMLNGGEGNDEYHFIDNFGFDIIDDTSGIDMLNFGSITNAANFINIDMENHTFSSAAGGFLSTDFFDCIERVKGTLGDDNITGNLLDNYLIGLKGNDNISGQAGNDFLEGREGNDILSGGSGIDILDGGDGNDILIGGADYDDMRGGAGDDTYILNRGDFRDCIRDTAGVNDVIKFGADISESNIAIFKNGLDLVLNYGLGQQFTIKDQFGITGAIEKIELDSGLYLTDSDISNIINDMNTYITDNDLNIAGVWDVMKNDGLMDIIEGYWQS